MQPTVLGALGAGMVDRGLMPRFLISYPETLVGKRIARPHLASAATVKAYEDHIREIVERFAKAADPINIIWEPLAIKEIGFWREEIEPRLAPKGDLAPIAAWASKVRGAHFIRLAALLAIMNERTTVTKGDALNAKGILRILMVDAQRAFSEMGASFATDDLVHLMAIVNTKLDPSKPFAKRDVMRKSNRFMHAPDRCADALQLAVDEGLLEASGRGWRVVK
jgi:hypothetical protein